MSKVYVVQLQPGFDMNPAKEFGDIRTVYMSGIQAYHDTDHFVHTARHALKDVTPDDYLVLTGDPVLMGICFSIMSELNQGTVNLLKWDRRIGERGGYQEVFVNTEAMPR